MTGKTDAQSPLAKLLWPMAQAAEALRALARESGLSLRTTAEVAVLPPSPPSAAARFGDWLEGAAAHLGVAITGVTLTGDELAVALRRSLPAMLQLPEAGLLLLVSAGPFTVTLIAPDHRRCRMPLARLQRLLFAAAAAPHRPSLRALLTHTRLTPATQLRIEDRLLHERLRHQPLLSGHVLAPLTAQPLVQQAQRLGLGRCLAGIATAYALDYLCGVLALLLLGQGALTGRLEAGWLAVSLVLLLSVVALRLFAVAQEERLAITGGVLLRERLLLGSLRCDPTQVRRDGIGSLLGRVLEAEPLEWLCGGGGLGLVLSAVEILLAGGLLLFSPGGLPVLAALLVSGVTLAAIAAAYVRRYRSWAGARLRISSMLIESMVGHRTRLAQLPPEQWQKDEDVALADYHLAARALDGRTLAMSLVPRFFFTGALLAFAPTLLTARALAPELALTLWAMLLATQALTQLAAGLPRLCAAQRSLQILGPLADAARLELTPPADLSMEAPAAAASGPALLLTARGLHYTPPGGKQPVLSNCELRIRESDRILLEGSSGCGKSTLAALLAGLRTPDRGLLLLHGRDLATLGARAWRRRIALAPQFHENHLLSAPLAFNLLMGRSWPPSPEELAEAELLCAELGLGPLLSRMPGGLLQQVGETGWQLSQGERSRIYLARALLQRAEVLILDESLGALDPQTLQQVAECLSRRAPALVLIAHP